MTNRAAALVEAERLLGLTRKAYNEGHDNIAETEKRGGKLFEASMDTCPWENWMERGNYSYFVSRILLSQRIYLYGRFCAHQMIEAYIKAFLKFKNAQVPKLHSLEKLLSEAQKIDRDGSSFFHSEEAETACLIFEPFYEIARYPVQITRPRDGKYIWISGIDEQILDYFSYQVRQLMQISEEEWHAYFKSRELYMAHEYNPDFHRIFTCNNLNFS